MLQHTRRKPLAAMMIAFALLPAATTAAQDDEFIDQPGPETAVAVLDGVGEMFSDLLGVREAVTQDLEILAEGPGRRVGVMIEGEALTLDLRPYSMRAPDCRFLVQDRRGTRQVAAPPVTTYRGRALEDRNLRVNASIVNGQLRAVILDRVQRAWTIEPVSRTIPGTPPTWHVVYRAEDVLPNIHECGVGIDIEAGDHGNPQPFGELAPPDEEQEMAKASLGGAGNGRTQIGFDADFEFYQANGSSVAATIADIEWIMNNVGPLYETQFADPICYVIKGFIVRTTSSDPYSSTNATNMLCEFTDEWNSNVANDSTGIIRDVAHLFTGKNLDGTTIGLAWPARVCNRTNSTNPNCNGGSKAYALSQNIANQTNRIILTAHELGHNWSACHCNQMNCTGSTTADADCGIMCSSVNCGSLVFGNRALNAIDNYRDNTATCLTTCLQNQFVDAAGPFCSETGTPACPWDTVTEGYDASHWTGGTLLIAPGSYNESILIDGYPAPLLIGRWPNRGSGSVIIGN